MRKGPDGLCTLVTREFDESAYSGALFVFVSRRRNRVKKWLHTKAVDRMTVQRLSERDPLGEVVSWLRMISRMSNESAQAAGPSTLNVES